MAQRVYEVDSITVVRSGKKHAADDLPRDAKEAVITFKAYEEVDGDDNRFLGTFDAHGSVESGNITWVQPDDLSAQLDASNPEGRAVEVVEQKAPEEIVPVVEEKK